LIDDEGQVVAVASSEYTYETPYPLWSEQESQLWWNATVESIRAVMQSSGVSADEVLGI
jgi:xylulokinase